MRRQYLASFIYSAAKAREGFSAASVHDGVSESPQVTVETGGLKKVFAFGSTPFNSQKAKALIDDKRALYEATEGHVMRPYTEAFHKQDPRSDQQLLDAITARIEDDSNQLSFPLILKPNAGSLANDVFVAKTPEEAQNALTVIRNNASWGEYVLVQQYLGDEQGPYPEIRAMCLDGECLIMYQRAIDGDAPEIWQGENIQAIENEWITAQVERLAHALKDEHDIEYIGLDLKIDRNGHLWLLEGNSSPMGLEKVKHQIPNGQALIDGLTGRILDKLSREAHSEAQVVEFFSPNRALEAH